MTNGAYNNIARNRSNGPGPIYKALIPETTYGFGPVHMSTHNQGHKENSVEQDFDFTLDCVLLFSEFHPPTYSTWTYPFQTVSTQHHV